MHTKRKKKKGRKHLECQEKGRKQRPAGKVRLEMKGGGFEGGALREARDVPTEHAQRVRSKYFCGSIGLFCCASFVLWTRPSPLQTEHAAIESHDCFRENTEAMQQGRVTRGGRSRHPPSGCFRDDIYIYILLARIFNFLLYKTHHVIANYCCLVVVMAIASRYCKCFLKWYVATGNWYQIRTR